MNISIDGYVGFFRKRLTLPSDIKRLRIIRAYKL